jgi:hypothetical protein
MTGGSYKVKDDDYEGDPTKAFEVSFSPMGAIFVIDNLAVGAMLPMSVTRYKYESDAKNVYSQILFAPVARYYFLSDMIRPFGQLAFGGGVSGSKYVDSDGDSDRTNDLITLLNVGGGAAFFISDNVAIDATLTYNYNRSKQVQDNDDNERYITHSVEFGFGITIIL